LDWFFVSTVKVAGRTVVGAFVQIPRRVVEITTVFAGHRAARFKASYQNQELIDIKGSEVERGGRLAVRVVVREQNK